MNYRKKFYTKLNLEAGIMALIVNAKKMGG